MLVLPNKNTIKGYFGKLGDAGSMSECSSVVKNVFQTHNGTRKHCKILVNEIHIKPSVQLQSGHLIGFLDDESEKLAKTVLAVMISPLMGKPSFVVRLIPVYSLKHEFLKIVHEASYYVNMVMCDNLRTNQSMFSTFHEDHESSSIFSVKHPIENSEYDEVFLLYDTVHLLKSILNN